MQTLISTNISAENWKNVYDGETTEVSSFTPFDYDKEVRMQGSSIVPRHDENDSVKGETYNLLSNGGLDASEDISVGLWVYFSDVFLHDLSLELYVDESNYMTLTIPKSILMDLCKKTDQITEQAFAWNYLELPISAFTKFGSISDNGTLKNFKNVKIDYSSAEILQNYKYSNFRFYGLFLQKSTTSNVSVTEKQDYTVYSFNFWDDDVINSIMLNDSLSTKNIASAVNYAWVGEMNLLNMQNFVSWQIILEKPNGEVKNYNFGDTITFDLTGSYTLSYKASSVNELYKFSLYDHIDIYVRGNNLIYFDFSNYKVKINEEYILPLRIDSVIDLNTVESVLVEVSNPDIVEVVSLDGYEYKVKASKIGKTDISIKLKAKRHNKVEVIEYTAKTNIQVEKVKTQNIGMKIFLYIALCVICIFAIVVAVKTIIDSRKNDVR